MRLLRFLTLLVLCSAVSLAQRSPASGSGDMPKLERFDVSMVDKSADPCTDFYKYACGRWMASHPIPADQAAWDVGGPLDLWNDTVLRETLEKAAQPSADRSANDQKI